MPAPGDQTRKRCKPPPASIVTGRCYVPKVQRALKESRASGNMPGWKKTIPVCLQAEQERGKSAGWRRRREGGRLWAPQMELYLQLQWGTMMRCELVEALSCMGCPEVMKLLLIEPHTGKSPEYSGQLCAGLRCSGTPLTMLLYTRHVCCLLIHQVLCVPM